MISLSHISKKYQVGDEAQQVLFDVDLHIQDAECLAIVGPSGSGKSTLMNIMGLLDTATTGRYQLDDHDVSSLSENQAADIRNQKIGFVFQQFHLLPRMKVIDNVMLPLTYRAMSPSTMQQQALSLLEQVGIADKAQVYPTQLSGGQQQRVAIARALVTQPQLILADEPTGALDSQTSSQIIDLFFSLQQQQGATLVVITHDVQVAEICPRQIHIKDGRLYES